MIHQICTILVLKNSAQLIEIVTLYYKYEEFSPKIMKYFCDPSWAMGMEYLGILPIPTTNKKKRQWWSEHTVTISFIKANIKFPAFFFSKRQREMYIRCPSPKYENGF